jgi:sec-independent protein translocase protein TatC
VIITAPVWLWNTWAFVAPGLKDKEKRYAIGFMASALPLFLAGTTLAWASLPGFVVALIGFTPEGSTNVINAADYVLFAIRILLIFGFAFVMPVVLVLMNFASLVTGRGILNSWRVAVLVIAIIAALATPVAEPMTMLLMMVPLMMLYFGAVGIAILNDKRRERRQSKLLTADELELD